MYFTETMTEKVLLFLKILWPILITQVGLYAMNIFDTVMSGRVGAEDLAGVAIGSSLWMPAFTGINGILMAVTPIVSQYIGAGMRHKITYSIMQAIYLSVALSIVVILIGAAFINPILQMMDLTPMVTYVAKHYLIGLSFGILPLFVGTVLRYFFDALGSTRVAMFIILLSLPVNFAFNYLLIFGMFGFPKLGGVGAGYATAITYWVFLAVGLMIALWSRHFRTYHLFRKRIKPSLKEWWEQLKIGVPIGLSVFFEVSIFAVITLLMSQFSTNVIAAHQAALNFASLIFMIPLSISIALTITVGYEVGGKRLAHAAQYSKLGITMALTILLFCSGGLYIFKEQIASFYSNDPEVILLAQQFLVFAIFYQLSDAAQASIQGVLRGYKDVTVPFVTALISYWGIGLPVGYYLANFTELRAFGYWLGITCGLTAAAIGFTFRLIHVQRKYREEKLTLKH